MPSAIVPLKTNLLQHSNSAILFFPLPWPRIKPWKSTIGQHRALDLRASPEKPASDSPQLGPASTLSFHTTPLKKTVPLVHCPDPKRWKQLAAETPHKSEHKSGLDGGNILPGQEERLWTLQLWVDMEAEVRLGKEREGRRQRKKEHSREERKVGQWKKKVVVNRFY